MVAPETPTEPLEVVAEAPVNATEPKSAKVTRALFSSKSSTIHSALYSQREPSEASLEKVCVTVLPVETFLMVATPAVLDLVGVICDSGRAAVQ